MQLQLKGELLFSNKYEKNLQENDVGPYKKINFHEFVVGINYVEIDVLSCLRDLNIS